MASARQLNLGCGPVVVPGWDNLDKSPGVLLARVPRFRALLGRVGVISKQQSAGFPEGVRFADLTKRLPYSDHSVDFIYCGHLIEHVSPANGRTLVRECRRVIKPGGLVRFSTPDLRQLATDYLAGVVDGRQTSADRFMERLGTHVDAEGSALKRFVVRNFSGFHHQWLYDWESLEALFRTAGFESLEQSRFHAAGFPDLDKLELRDEGLFINAAG